VTSGFHSDAFASPRLSQQQSPLPPAGRGVHVLGAGGHAKVVISTLRALGIEVTGLYDDDPTKQGSTCAGVPVLGSISSLTSDMVSESVLAIGDNAARQKLARRMSWAHWLTVVHPKAYVHDSVRLGPGTVVFAGVVVQPDAQIGAHCIINTGTTVDHGCVIGDFCHLAPGCNIGGSVTLAEGVLMGIGSVAIPSVSVGAWTAVGAAAAVASDLPARVLAVGAPARVLRKLEP
jgi:sugar O-acyltransferase (sialic acid O-acetyltransferase NeuD family)